MVRDNDRLHIDPDRLPGGIRAARDGLVVRSGFPASAMPTAAAFASLIFC